MVPLLLVCVVSGTSILFALLGGLVLFSLDGKRKGFSWAALLGMMLQGMRTVKNLLITFLLVGILTALWRASGTIAVLVTSTSGFMRPALFLLMAFLLNCGVSILTGTALGTAATMGVVCMMMARAMGISPSWAGGAVLAGAFFGDRCSPVSTSALLVAQLTRTDIFTNIRGMLRTALVPFLLSCAVYTTAGLVMRPAGPGADVNSLFAQGFVISWAALLPALAILLLSLLRVNVRIAMSVSILLAALVCLFVQGMSLPVLLRTAVFGYSAQDTALAALVNGGGILSMVQVAAIVCLSSSYSGIFRKTGLLDEIKGRIAALSARTTPYAAALCTGAVSSAVACNQTLAIMLTHQLCEEIYDAPTALAIDLEDTAVVLSPLVPWSIASAVPLATLGVTALSIPAACFLYLLPLWRLMTQKGAAAASL